MICAALPPEHTWPPWERSLPTFLVRLGVPWTSCSLSWRAAPNIIIVSSLQAGLVDGCKGACLRSAAPPCWEVAEVRGVMAFRTTAFKVLEGMNDSTAGTVMRLGQSMARAGGKEKRVARCLFQHLSILLMIGSSSLILSGSHVSH